MLNILSVCADTLNTYGKTPGQLVNAGKAFNMVLADCNALDVRNAFEVWMRRSSEMPTPFDILNLVQRKGKPPLDRAVYIALCKRRAADPYAYNVLSADEANYIKDFEKFQITGRVE